MEGNGEDYDTDNSINKKRKLNNNSEQIIKSIPIEKEDQIDKEDNPFLTETELGIEKFIHERAGFHCLYKQRFSDFIVSEVDEKGNVVSLTNTDLPEVDLLEKKRALERKSVDISDKILMAKNEFGEEIANKISKLTVDSNFEVEEFSGDFFESKEGRTKFHKLLKEYFPHLVSNTGKDKDGKTVIEVRKSGKRKKQYRDWPKTKPNFLKFVLFKENTDHTTAFYTFQKYTGIHVNAFATAGTKDKRAITSQNVTCFKVEAEKLSNINSVLPPHIKTGNYEYVDEALKLGSLSGNKFTITLREVDAEDDLLIQACNEVKETGFINYFGTQRFGTGSVATHLIGIACLQEDWDNVVDLILKSRPGESVPVTNARKYYEEKKDIDGALELFPRKLSVERGLLEGLKKKGATDKLGAFQTLPRQMQLMYLHAYQSWLWNKMVSRRLSLSSENLLIGDIVQEKNTENYIYITEENKHEYSILDVVLTLPGHNILYPKHEVTDYLVELMKQHNLSPYDMKRKVKMFSLPGGYRLMLKKPSSFNFTIKRYDDYTLPLVLSDYEKLQKKPEIESIPNGKLKALIIEFILDSSTYATMLIRELTHRSTSMAFQRELTGKLD